MSMRKRSSILEDCSVRHAWQETDPGNLCQPLKQRKAEPLCHCAPPEKGRLGGMDPVINRAAGKVFCRTCQKEIGPGCRRRQVVHLRGLIALSEKTPGNVDWDDIRDAGWLL